MGRWIAKLGPLVGYFCTATVISQLIGISYLIVGGQIDANKWLDVMAVVHGIDLAALTASDEITAESSREQISLADIHAQRIIRTRNLELREEALKGQLSLIREQKRKLVEGSGKLDRLSKAFKAQVDKKREEVEKAGQENEVQTMIKLNPTQAKEILRRRLTDGQLKSVVTLLANIPIANRAKIVTQFKTPEELDQLNEILLQMRKGGQEAELIDQIQDQLNKQQAATP